MSTIIQAPSTLAPSLSSFLDAYMRSQKADQTSDKLENQNALIAFQMTEALRKQQESQGLRSMIERMSEVPPETITSTPPSTLDYPGIDTATVDPLLAQPPPPPPVTTSGLTPEAVNRAMGPGAIGQVLSTEAGREAFKAMGGMTADVLKEKARTATEKVEKQMRIEKARSGIQQALVASMQARADGDPVAAYDYDAAAKRAALPAVDPQNQAQLLKDIDAIMKERDALVKDKDELARAKADGPIQARSVKLMLQGAHDNNPAMFQEGIDLAVTVTGKAGRAWSDKVLEHAAQKAQVAKPDERAVVMAKIATRTADAFGVGYTLSPEQGSAIILGVAEEDRPQFMRVSLALKKDKMLPLAWEKIAFGEVFSDSTHDAASISVFTQNLALTSPQGAAAYLQALKEIKEAERAPDLSGPRADRSDLRTAYSNSMIEVRSLRTTLKDAKSNVLLTPADVEKADTQYRAAVDRARNIHKALREMNPKLPEWVEPPPEEEKPKPAPSSPKQKQPAGGLPKSQNPRGPWEPTKPISPTTGRRAATMAEIAEVKRLAPGDGARQRALLEKKGIDYTLAPVP